MGTTPGTPRDRRVLVIVAAIVAGLLLASVVSALVPGVDALLAAAPLVIVALVLGTVLVLIRSVGRGAG